MRRSRSTTSSSDPCDCHPRHARRRHRATHATAIRGARTIRRPQGGEGRTGKPKKGAQWSLLCDVCGDKRTCAPLRHRPWPHAPYKVTPAQGFTTTTRSVAVRSVHTRAGAFALPRFRRARYGRDEQKRANTGGAVGRRDGGHGKALPPQNAAHAHGHASRRPVLPPATRGPARSRWRARWGARRRRRRAAAAAHESSHLPFAGGGP
jgi:hypothetical protein